MSLFRDRREYARVPTDSGEDVPERKKPSNLDRLRGFIVAGVIVIGGLLVIVVVLDNPSRLRSASAEVRSMNVDCPDYSDYSREPHEPRSNGSLRLPFMRPPPSCRTFASESVDSIIERLGPRFRDPDLAMLFTNAFSQTLDTTVRWQSSDYAFIVTGDINAEWLRDTYNQMSVYLAFLEEDEGLRKLVKKIVALQARYITEYPFCNSFQAPKESGIPPVHNSAANGALVEPDYDSNVVFECKYELDSLAGFLALSTRYFEATKDLSLLTDRKSQWLAAFSKIISTLRSQQLSTLDPRGFIQSSYNFSSTLDVVINGGVGPPQRATGMVGTSFRPSDDKVDFRFNIADNAMISMELGRVARTLEGAHPDLSSEAGNLSTQIRDAIDKHGIVEHPEWGKVYAFEVDGYGSYILMDDANVPSLLSLPVIGYTNGSDPVYINTRKMILSEKGNPYFNRGVRGAAIGSPHTGIQHVWPMSLVSQILTSSSDEEILECLDTIKKNTAGLGLIHESFDVHNEGSYSRPWFAWANSYFAQAVLALAKDKPHLIFNDAWTS